MNKQSEANRVPMSPAQIQAQALFVACALGSDDNVSTRPPMR